MNKFLRRLLLFEKFEIQTKLSKKEILKKAESLVDPKYNDYYGYVSENEFTVAEKQRKRFVVGHTQNSLAPVAKANIREENDVCNISIVIRMNALVLALFMPLYLISLILILPFPFMLLLLHFAFFKPVKKLKDTLEDLFIKK